MRGEAYFVFSTFATINIKELKQFSNQCLEYVQQNISSVGKQIFNAKIPSNICFAIAIVDYLNLETKQSIRLDNPWAEKVDILWYEVPIIYVINEKAIYFYDQPSFWDNFKGEIVWKRLRAIIEELLQPN